MSNFLNSFLAFLSALGVFEVLKRIIPDYYEKVILAWDEEVRQIANEVMDIAVSSRANNFEVIPGADVRTMLINYSYKVDNVDKDFSLKIVRLANIPSYLSTLKDRSDRDSRAVTNYGDQLNHAYDDVETLIYLCEKYRHSHLNQIQIWLRDLKNRLKFPKRKRN